MAEVTIKTIAQEAGVSTSLVSQVLNNRNVRVAPETRERIKRTAEHYHYVPNTLACCLKLKQTHTIALLAPFTPYGFFGKLIFHVEKYAQRAGYLTMVINTFEDKVEEEKELALYRSGMFDGMLVAPLSSPSGDEMLKQMHQDSYPFVCVDRFNPALDVPVVSSDHETVAYEMTKRELEKGKKDIVFLHRGDRLNTSGQLRLSGYERAMKDAGLKPEFHSFSYPNAAEGHQDIQRMLRSLGRQPEAMFIHSGYYFPTIVQSSMDLGFAVSEMDYLMVDGFSIEAQETDQHVIIESIMGRCLVAIQDIDTIAKNAVSLLIDRIEQRENGGESVMVPTEYRAF